MSRFETLLSVPSLRRYIMGWVDGAGYKLLLHALKALKVDNVLVRPGFI
jgi:hypothetical protein